MSDRILYYNWAPYFRDPVVGGGISVYVRNLLDHLDGESLGYTPTFLYAGFDYAAVSARLRLRRVANPRHPRVRTFSLVNSPVPAPSLLSFYDPASSVSSPDLEKRFARFLRRYGPFRVVHFHSLEGLTAGCLKTAQESGARVVLSLHNYWPVCPQVQLWQFEAQPCSDFSQGRACASCLTDRVDTELTLTHRRMSGGGTLAPGADARLRVKAAAAVRFPAYRRWLRSASLKGNPWARRSPCPDHDYRSWRPPTGNGGRTSSAS